MTVAAGPGCGPEDAARPVPPAPAAALPAPAIYRFCRCGQLRASVPCDECRDREPARAAFRALLEAKRSTATKRRR